MEYTIQCPINHNPIYLGQCDQPNHKFQGGSLCQPQVCAPTTRFRFFWILLAVWFAQIFLVCNMFAHYPSQGTNMQLGGNSSACNGWQLSGSQQLTSISQRITAERFTRQTSTIRLPPSVFWLLSPSPCLFGFHPIVGSIIPLTNQLMLPYPHPQQRQGMTWG